MDKAPRRLSRRGEIQKPDELADQWLVSDWSCASSRRSRHNLPFPTWSIAPEWMPAGTAIEILTARDDTRSPSFFIEPSVLAIKEKAEIDSAGPAQTANAASDHPIGVERVTGIQLIRPNDY
jgi:hypothetical protein